MDLTPPGPLSMMTLDGDGGRMRVEEEVGYNWDELNKLAKRIEQDIDGIFANSVNTLPYGRTSQTASSSTEHAKISELEEMLKRLSNIIDMMSELLEQLGQPKNGSTSASHLLNRHREVYQEYQRDLKKLRVYDQIQILAYL